MQIHGALSLSRTMVDEDEVVLVPWPEWPRARTNGYRQIDWREALWMLENLARHRWLEVRSFLASSRLGNLDVSMMDDHEVLKRVRDAVRDGRVTAVQKGAAVSGGSGASVELRRLVAQIEKQTRGKLSFRGRQYKLVAGDSLARVPGRDYYEVVSQSDARAVLERLAEESLASADLFGSASAKLSKDWHAPISQPDGLVLLRRLPVQASRHEDTGPAITPSQMKALLDAEEPTIRLVSIEAPIFVPGQETNAISFAIDGPVAKAASVVMVVKSVAPKRDAVVVGEVAVPGPYLAAGKIDWDGRVPGLAGVVTLKGSPYEISFELTSTSGKTSTSDPGRIRVEVHGIAIVVDNGEDDPFDGDASARALKGLVAELKKSGMPSDCAGRLLIDSPVFKTDRTEMKTAASFDEYKKAVGNGPAVPLRALVKLKSKSGGGKRSPAALDGTRILWDFKLAMTPDLDRALEGRGVHPEAKAFIKRVACYQESLTRPMGVSVHFKLGGWRAKLADRDSAGKQWKDKDDWALSPPAKRKWAALTLCEGEDDAPTDSGVTFLPGRMAGDVHRIRAFVDVDETLDVEDEAALNGTPAARRSNLIEIATWRRVPVVGNWIVGATTAPVDLPSLASEYKKAAMLVEAAAPAGPPKDVAKDWQKVYEGVVDGYMGQPDTDPEVKFLKDTLERTADGYPVRYRDFMDYWQRINANAGFFGRLWERIRNFFGAGDEAEYRRKCNKKAVMLALRVARGLSLPPDGITALKFGCFGPHNQVPDEKGTDVTVGIAPDPGGSGFRNRAIFLQFTPSKGTDTFIHEVGHTLFLAHAPGHWEAGTQPGGYQSNAHDKDQICIMSYHPAAKHLCGLCLLKLAGVDYMKIRNDGTTKE